MNVESRRDLTLSIARERAEIEMQENGEDNFKSTGDNNSIMSDASLRVSINVRSRRLIPSSARRHAAFRSHPKSHVLSKRANTWSVIIESIFNFPQTADSPDDGFRGNERSRPARSVSRLRERKAE